MFRSPRRYSLMLAAAVPFATLAGCFDDDDVAGPQIDAIDISVAVNSTTAPSLVGADFTFSDGSIVHPDFSGQSVTFNFGSTSTATITTPGGQVGTNVSYGSCTFTVTSSSVAQLPVGTVLTFPSCQANINSAGAVDVGGSASGTVRFQLQGQTSGSFKNVTISVDQSGSTATVSVDGTVVAVGEISGGGFTGSGSGS